MAFNQDESTYTEHGRRIPRPSHNFVPEYQQSGIPHLETRSLNTVAFNAGARDVQATHKFAFKSVTRWVTINCSGAGRLYFNVTAANAEADTHYFLLPASSTVRLELKCKEIYIIPDADATNVSVIAGLTSVSDEDFPDQTKSNGFLGVQS